MNITLFLLIGLLGAVTMFAGDMALYYDKNDFVSDGTMRPVLAIMKNVSRKRLYIGSMLGPVAAFFYAVGYYHCVLMMEKWQALGYICFLVNALGIIMGGAYHSHWVYYGQLEKLEDEAALKEVLDFSVLLNRVAYAVIGLGFAMMLIFTALGATVFPRWLALFTPGVLFLLTSLVKKIPKGRMHMIAAGGWSNLISIVYYLAALIAVQA